MAVEVTMPRLSDSMEEGTIIEWLVAEGDEVRRGRPIVEVETDKANMPYEADADGVLLKILVAAGESAAVGATIAYIGEAGEEAPEGSSVSSAPDLGADGGLAQGAEREPVEAPVLSTGDGPAVTNPAANGGTPTPSGATATATRPGRVPASPLARRIASDLGVDLAAVAGTGPKGRVVRADVEAAARTPAPEAPPVAPPAATRAPVAGGDRARGDVEAVPLTKLQGVVARRMAESRATVPDFELRVDVDMGAAVEMREQLKRLAGERGVVPSYNDMIVKAAALALREFPRVNGAYRDGAFELFSRINVGVAVAADDALVVPTVFDADNRTLSDIARTTRELAAKVRDASITPPELSGGTFTVSNLGMFGIDSFSAVINVPQAAILAVGALKKRPMATEDDRLVVRPALTLTLACDHRILYGADGARFLSHVRDLLEQPLSFTL